MKISKITQSLLVCLLVVTGVKAQNCNFYSDYSVPGNWTQVGTNVRVNNGEVQFINDAADGEQRRVHTSLGTTLDAGDNWTAEFEFTPTSIGTRTGHVVLGLTQDDREFFYDCQSTTNCAGYPYGTQNVISVVYMGEAGSQGFGLWTRDGSSHFNTSIITAPGLNVTYYITLKRTSPTDVSLHIYNNPIKDINSLIGQRVMSSSFYANINGLTTVQHGASAGGSSSRTLNGAIDELCITYDETVCSHFYDYDSSTDWTQVGTNVQIDNGEVQFINDAADGVQRRVHTDLGVTLNAVNNWKTEFEFTPTSIGTRTGHVILGLTENDGEFFYDCISPTDCTGYPYGSQNVISVVYIGNAGSQGFGLWTRDGNSHYNTSTIQAAALNTTYYMTLERVSPSEVSLYVYSDQAKNNLIGQRVMTSSFYENIDGLTTLQHGASAGGSPSRKLNGTIDNVCIYHDLTVVKSNSPSVSDKLSKETPSNLNVYPNPSTTGVYNIDFDDSTDAQVQVYSLTGELVLNQQTSDASFVLNISEQPKGVYILKVFSGDEMTISRVVRD